MHAWNKGDELRAKRKDNDDIMFSIFSSVLHNEECHGLGWIQSSNGIRIFAGASASTGTEAEAELCCPCAELFCTSVVAEAPGIAVTSVDTGAPFNTGSPVVTYIF